MGLDMYLVGKRYLWSSDGDEDLQAQIAALFPELPSNKRWGKEEVRIQEVRAELGYWRKANHIHQWFVENVQGGEDDCGNYYVEREQLQTLVDLCKEVLENRGTANEKLPTASGFFFGSTEYDDYYYQDLELTISQLEKAIALPVNWDIEYHSSW